MFYNFIITNIKAQSNSSFQKTKLQNFSNQFVFFFTNLFLLLKYLKIEGGRVVGRLIKTEMTSHKNSQRAIRRPGQSPRFYTRTLRAKSSITIKNRWRLNQFGQSHRRFLVLNRPQNRHFDLKTNGIANILWVNSDLQF